MLRTTIADLERKLGEAVASKQHAVAAKLRESLTAVRAALKQSSPKKKAV